VNSRTSNSSVRISLVFDKPSIPIRKRRRYRKERIHEVRGEEFLHMVHQVGFRHHAEWEQERVNPKGFTHAARTEAAQTRDNFFPLFADTSLSSPFEARKPKNIARQEDSHERNRR